MKKNWDKRALCSSMNNLEINGIWSIVCYTKCEIVLDKPLYQFKEWKKIEIKEHFVHEQ
jgi:hypothetical protein